MFLCVEEEEFKDRERKKSITPRRSIVVDADSDSEDDEDDGWTVVASDHDDNYEHENVNNTNQMKEHEIY